MKINHLKLGSILSYVQMGLSIIIGITYTPVMLRLLGQSEYGLYSTVSSTISMLSVLSLGFNSSYIRYFSKYKAEKNEEAIDKLNGMFLIIFTIIGLIAFLCGSFLSLNLRIVFDKGLTSDEYDLAKKLMLLLTINLSISFPMSVFQNIISAHEKYVFLKLLGMLKTVLGPLVTLPLLLMGHRSIAMVTVTFIISLLADILYLTYSKSILKVKFSFKNFEKGIFKSLFVYTSFIALNLIIDQINSNLDKFLLGRYQGTETVAVYSIGSYIFGYYVMFSTAISNVFSPRIHRIVNENKNNSILQSKLLTELFVKVGRIQYIILALILSGFVFLGKTFIMLWAGVEYEESYIVALLLMIPVTIPLIQNLGIEIQRALNKHQFRSLMYSIMAIINVVLTIFLCQKYGAIGAAVGTAISYIVMNGIIINLYYHKKCSINIILFWKNIIRLSIGLIIPLVYGLIISTILKPSTLTELIIQILVYSAIYCISMWIFGMSTYEKDLFIVPLLKLRKRMYDKNK